MKKMLVLIVVIALGLMLMPVTMVMAGGDKNRGEIGQGGTYENGCVDQPCFAEAPKPGTLATMDSKAAVQTTVLNETEIADLMFIREEEKIARDVYRVLYKKWGNPVFAIIAESEQAHMDAMARLLSFYGIEDPVTSDEIGVFTDPAIGDLYERLIAWGSISKEDALLVGGYIEEYDILDIWKAYGETDKERINRVYQNLYEGSYKHLHAFVYNYGLLTGSSYQPQLLTDEQYKYVMEFDTRAKQIQTPKQRQGR